MSNFDEVSTQMKTSEIAAYYLKKVGFEGTLTPDLKTLGELQYRHLIAFPFENTDPFTGQVPLLDIRPLAEKFLRHPQGGYCYEHNLLFEFVLKEAGFEVRGLGGRVIWNQPPDKITRKTHMLLLVKTKEGEYITDTGFGGVAMGAPLELYNRESQPTPFGDFKLSIINGDYILNVKSEEEWKSVYRFDLGRTYLPDYELTNWFLCHYPNLFTQSLVAIRNFPDKKLTLHNNLMKTRLSDGSQSEKQLESPGEIISVLKNDFGIELGNPEKLIKSLQQKVFSL